MALSRVVSEIFNVEKCRDLEIRVKGHSRSLKRCMCMCMIVYDFLLVFYNNFVPKIHPVFEKFDFKIAVILKTGLGSVNVIRNVTIR